MASESNAAPKTEFTDAKATKQLAPSGSDGGVQLEKELGLLDCVVIIVGVIIGAGIFVSPKGVLLHSGSIGQAIIVWVFSGILSMVGALCYAELGDCISCKIHIKMVNRFELAEAINKLVN